MHRDVKIGLILGVLLVGLVAALFFRREKDDGPGLADPAPSATSPEDDTLVQLDPPLKLEEVPPAAQREDSDAPTDGPALPLLDPQSDTLASRPGATVVPRALEDHVQPLPERSFPPVGQQPDAGTHSETTRQPPRPAVTGSPTRHRIASGDTLWELAVRYLGDGSRSDEIFRANRSILSSPDVLPVGKEIVIPARTTAASRRRVAPQPTALTQRPGMTTRLPTAVTHRTGSAPRRPTAATPRPAPAQLQAPPVVLRSRPSVRRSTTPSRRGTSSAGTAKQYTVREGDTLYSIARRIYNDASRWIDIYRANRSVLANPDALKTGLTLRLP